MDLLYKKRQDFEVHSTVKNADLKNKKWGKNIYFENDSDYNEYINKYIYLHINTYKTFSAWDIPTTDCLSMSIPTLCPYGFCYKEMLDPEYPFFYQTNNIDDFINKVEMAIISPRLRNQAIKIWRSIRLLKHCQDQRNQRNLITKLPKHCQDQRN